MKIVLDLKKTFNNYDWNKEELKKWIDDEIFVKLWELYRQSEDIEDISDETRNRLYDLLDMFWNYGIIDD